MTHEEEYYWVVMKPEAESFSLGHQVIMCKMIWEDGLVEWLLPGSMALWKPDKDFMILEKVPTVDRASSYLIAAERHILHRNESWDALERLINDRELAREG